jgi:poly(3-hydroxybutyrate) depolymerase
MQPRSRRLRIAVMLAVLSLLAVGTAWATCTRSTQIAPAHEAQQNAARSPGCGSSAQGAGQFVTQTLTVAEQTRSYHVRLPDGYDPARAYPLIFRFHGYSGNGLSGGLEIERSAGAAAMIVAADGLDAAWGERNEKRDLAFFDAMYETLSQRYCVDLRRVFAYGFSMGGGLVNLLSCVRADKLRASASIAGVERGQRRCLGPVAAWFMHDRDDDTVPIRAGENARERARARNRCHGEPVRLSGGCLRYEGCAAGAPVVWCETTGFGHSVDGADASERVWEFFRSLP